MNEPRNNRRARSQFAHPQTRPWAAGTAVYVGINTDAERRTRARHRAQQVVHRLVSATALMIFAMTSGAAQPAAPAPFTATYQVSYRGLGAGELIFTLSRDAASGRYIYETRAHPSMLARLVVSSAAVERSVIEIDANGARPLEWRLDDGRSGASGDGELRFDWAQGAVTGRIEGEDVRLPTEPNMQDRLSIQIAATAALLRGETPGPFPLIDDNRIKRYTYTKKDAATLDSPLGRVETVLYESAREGSSRLSRFWFAPKFDYIPVRAEQIRKGRVETVMMLASFKSGDRQEADSQ